LRGVPDTVAEAVLERYKGEFYAVAAALAKALYKEWRDPARVVEAVKRLDVHSLALAYLWHVVLGGDEADAKQAAPLILATGFFGPHPPKLAKAVIRAFGKEPEDAIVRWFSQPLHGTLYEAIREVAHGAVYRRFGVGGDELCQGSVEGPCRLVGICSEPLVGVPRKRYRGVEKVAWEYAKLVAKALDAPGPAGVRQIDFLIDDFLRAYNGVAEGGRWKIRYKTLEGRVVEDDVDELDVLSASYGLAALPVWIPQPLEDWFIVGGKKAKVIMLYIFPLLRKRSGELVKRTVAVPRVGWFAYVDFSRPQDFQRPMRIAVTERWDMATDEELEKAVRLAAGALLRVASPIALIHVWSLLSEAWRRVIIGETQGDEGKRQRLADRLTVVAYNAARGRPSHLPRIFVPEKEKSDSETVAQRFGALYNVASNAGKLRLLETLLYALDWDFDGVNLAAVLLGKPQFRRRRALEEVTKRIEGFVSHLDGVERAYVVALLYPRLAKQYASFSEFDKAVALAEESLNALEELWKVYGENKASIEERLLPYLALKRVKPNLEKELNEISLRVYSHAALTYKKVYELEEAVEYAEKACKLAGELGSVYYEVSSCGLLLRLKAVREGIPPVEEYEELWQRVLQIVERLGAKAIATTLGEYVVALASAGRLGEVEKALEEWGRALELRPVTEALTYNVLSLIIGQHLENAAEADLFAKELKITMSAMKMLALIYGEEAVKALFEIVPSSKLFLFALVGLTLCKSGEKWGLKLAREAARAGSQRFEGIGGRLFGELYKALEGVKVDKCITDEVLKSVYKLYYLHI